MHPRDSFNDVAELYEGVRPGYPPALFDDMAALAHLAPGDPVLEVGCGTGQATRSLARAGYDVLATDPGPDLIRVATSALADFPNLRFAVGRFEDLAPAPGAYALVAAAQSWHWVAPERRFAKAAAALRPGGALAVFGNVPVGLSPAMLAALTRIYDTHAPGLWGPPPETWYLPSGPVAGLFAEAPDFAPVAHRGYAWTWSLDAPTYIAFLRTRSDLQTLAPAQREPIFAAIADAIADQGGRFEIAYEAHLYLAGKV